MLQAVKRLKWDWRGEHLLHLRLTKSDFWYSFFLFFANSCFYVQKWVFFFLIVLFFWLILTNLISLQE